MILRLVGPGVRLRVGVVVALLLVITATYVGQGILVARILAGIFKGADLNGIAWQLGGIAALQAVRSWCLAVRETAAARASGIVKGRLRQQLVSKLLALGPGWSRVGRTGSTQSSLVDGIETADAYVGRFLPQVAATIIGAVAVTAYLFVLDPLVGLVVLGCAVVLPLLPFASDGMMRERHRSWVIGYRGMYAENLDALQGMATLKAFNASERRGRELARIAADFCRESIRLMAVVVLYAGGVPFVIGLGTAIAVGAGALRLAEGALTPTDLLLILLLTAECFRPLRDLETAWHASYNSVPSLRAVLEVIDTPEQHAGQATLTSATPAVAFNDVTFTYNQGGRPALDRFSLTIAPGERVALVGRSGAGKTTVAALLLRFFDPEEGRITIDGRDIRDLSLPALRALVSVVSQETYLFHGTVRRNLALARPDATDEELVAAAKAAQAHAFIAALPDGYDTIVGERGLKLSGGERQRIAIARALLKDAPILVLDEATSSMDAANEAGVQRALETLTATRTTLMIAHRLSTVRDADRVIVMAGGRVTEAGTHHDLLGSRGAYARLVAAQEGAA